MFKSIHHSWKYVRNCEWVFFSEHSVHIGYVGHQFAVALNWKRKILIQNRFIYTAY